MHVVTGLHPTRVQNSIRSPPPRLNNRRPAASRQPQPTTMSPVHNGRPLIRSRNLCEAYEDGLVTWNSRVDGLLVGGGQDVRAAKELRSVLVEGPAELGEVYRRYYRQAGRHFAIGDEDVRSRLEKLLHILTVGTYETSLHGLAIIYTDFVSHYQAWLKYSNSRMMMLFRAFLAYPVHSTNTRPSTSSCCGKELAKSRQRPSQHSRISSTGYRRGLSRCTLCRPSRAPQLRRAHRTRTTTRASSAACDRRSIARGMCTTSCLASTQYGLSISAPRGPMSCAILRRSS
jgi:hypothetical protein